jgi:hypothetical protein
MVVMLKSDMVPLREMHSTLPYSKITVFILKWNRIFTFSKMGFWLESDHMNLSEWVDF